jgi:hypothetical protein
MKGIITTALVCGLALGTSVAVAQKPAHTPTAHHRASGQSSAPKPKRNAFKGVAAKLNTTPEALQSAYDAAKATNPKLTRGQFIAANMLANNLGAKNPAITVPAILDGLKGGKSMGQTLQGLGLSAKDAKAAQRQAAKDTKAAVDESKEKEPS